MQSLATKLRNEVMSVLIQHCGGNGLTDEDYTFLDVIKLWGYVRERTVTDTAELDKILAGYGLKRSNEGEYMAAGMGATGPDAKREAWTGPVGDPGVKGDIGDIGPKPVELPTTAPGDTAFSRALGSVPSAAPLTDTTDQANLPLGEADRGPEPQEAGTLLSTEAPPDFDPSDPPPDYTRLDTAATRRLDT